MRTTLFVLSLAVTLVVGCAPQLVLTSAGARVTRVDRGHLPDDCSVVGDVSIGIPPDAAFANSEAELVVLMRNKAAQIGGDHVVVEQATLQPADSGGAGHWVGSGSAYACNAPTGGTSGGATDTTQ